MNAPDAADLDLVERIARDAFGSATTLRQRARASRASNLEVSISALAKQLSKRATDAVEDRKSKAIARTETYNAVRPVLEAMAQHHHRLARRSQWLAIGIAALSCAVAAYLSLT